MSQSGGFLSWKIGQQPNAALMYVGFCCCCGFPTVAHLHALRNELKNAFPEIEDDMHWIYVIISIIGLYKNEEQLAALEAKNNIANAASSLPWWLPFILPIMWPAVLASQMKRLNALVEATQK